MSGRVYLGTQFSPEERRAPATYTSDRRPALARALHGVNVLRMRGLMLDPSFSGKTFREAALECAKVGVLLSAVQSQETGQIVSTRRG